MDISIPFNDQPQELIYKTVNETPLYISFLPPAAKKRENAPVAALICGGGWQIQSREAILGMFASLVAQLRQAGVCVVCMDYRVTSLFPGITIAEEVADVLDALSYLRSYASVLKIDTDRIVVSGHSAGGHITMLMCNAPSKLFPTEYPDPVSSYAGCVPVSAPCFLYPSELCPETLRMDYSYVFPGAVYNDGLAHLWSPYEYIDAGSPATLLVHGAADDLVPDSNSLASYRKGLDAGADFTLIHPVNGGHCMEPMEAGMAVSPSFDEVQNKIAAWIIKTCDL